MAHLHCLQMCRDIVMFPVRADAVPCSTPYGPHWALNGNTQESTIGGGVTATAANTNYLPTVIASPGLAAFQLRLDRAYDDIVAVEVRSCMLPHAGGLRMLAALGAGPCWGTGARTKGVAAHCIAHTGPLCVILCTWVWFGWHGGAHSLSSYR